MCVCVCVCVCACAHVHMNLCVHVKFRAQPIRRGTSPTLWVPGIKPTKSGLAASSFTCWAISWTQLSSYIPKLLILLKNKSYIVLFSSSLLTCWANIFPTAKFHFHFEINVTLPLTTISIITWHLHTNVSMIFKFLPDLWEKQEASQVIMSLLVINMINI